MINADKKSQWDADILNSKDFYNRWFLTHAPALFRARRAPAKALVEEALLVSDGLNNLTIPVLKANPRILSSLRMCTCPPIARDRLVGLADVPKDLVKVMETGKIPKKMRTGDLDIHLGKALSVLRNMLDYELFPWVEAGRKPSDSDIKHASVVIADRLCASHANPDIRNAQEKRQLGEITKYLEAKGYVEKRPKSSIQEMEPGTFAFIVNVKIPSATVKKKERKIPVDAIVQPWKPQPGKLPIMIEAKSAGDYTNTNKRQKEEGNKGHRLRTEFKDSLTYVLFLCGYFGETYLQYETDEGFDWIWEHRISDLDQLGL